MYFIEEHKRQHCSVFDVCTRDSKGQKIVLRTIRAVSIVTQTSDGRMCYLIYDESMKVIEPIYRFLRLKTGCNGRTLAPNTIEHRRTSLRYLVVFCEAYNLKDFFIPELYCNDFVDFLYRENNQSSSAAVYFSDIKLFLKFIGHEKDPIMTVSYRKGFVEGADGVSRPALVERYIYAPKPNIDREKVCPPHNTIEDFVKIQKVMSDAGDITGCIIVILEFYLGRRNGEVLGLTIEDVATRVNVETGEVSHCLIIRNRRTDRTGCSAKNRTHPKSVKQYSNPDYIKEYSHPKNCIQIDDAMFELIQRYIKVEHQQAMTEHPERYAEGVADVVNPEQFNADWDMIENHYLFINNLGGPLTKAAWNKRLHQYYNLAGIPLGVGKSINHAWRHMIAYILKHELHWEDTKIADYLGHKGPGTVKVYASADYETMGAIYQTVGEYITGKINSLKVDAE